MSAWATPSASQTTSTRRAVPSHQPWNAHPYQRRAVAHLKASHVAALWLDPGLGKTSVTLQAFADLKAAGVVRTMLVVAPLRVCQTVWRQEAQKWTQFRDLKFSLLHGAKKDERLKDDADIWLVNPEGVQWLAKKYSLRNLPFDVVVVDELTKFKNHQSERSKTLRPRLKGVRYKWGLTGTPAPNGYMDLFGQFLLLDEGAALGRYITHYRDTYFQVEYDGFTYKLMPGAQARIEAKVRPYVLCMSADDYLTLPPITDDIRCIDLPPKARATYSEMKKQMLASLPEGEVTASNAAAVYSKLAQMANGAVYIDDDKNFASIHDAKIEALEDLIEELSGQQLLLAYEFRHDAERLKTHFGDRMVHLAPGLSAAATEQIIRDWNAGRIGFLAAHPASAGHGLNLQESGAGHVAWFSPTWDLELYDQFIKRVRRQGSAAQRIVNHLLLVRDSIDELKLTALTDKNATQGRLMSGMKEILHNAETQPQGHSAATQEKSPMVAKLSRQDGSAPQGSGFFGRRPVETAESPAQQPRPQAESRPAIRPAGWGPSTATEPETTPTPVQRTEALLRTGEVLEPPIQPGGMQHFSQGLREQVDTVAKGPWRDAPAPQVTEAVEVQPEISAKEVEAEKPKRTRAKKEPAPFVTDADVTPALRLDILRLAFADGGTTLQDGMEIAREFLEFVTGE